MHNWENYMHPVDFVLPDNPTLEKMKQEEILKIW